MGKKKEKKESFYIYKNQKLAIQKKKELKEKLIFD